MGATLSSGMPSSPSVPLAAVASVASFSISAGGWMPLWGGASSSQVCGVHPSLSALPDCSSRERARMRSSLLAAASWG